MSFKTILVCLNEIDRVPVVLALAADLAAKDDAHVIGLYVIPSPRIYPAVGPGVAASATVLDQYAEFFKARSDAVRQQFEDAMAGNKLASEWRQVESHSPDIGAAVVEHGLEADLVVISQVNPDSEAAIEPDFAERVVMECGRPVLIVPAFGDFEACGRRVLVGWNARRESARAAFDAGPILARAESVHLVWIGDEADKPLPGSGLAAALGRHGAKATAEAMAAGDVDVGNLLLSRASDLGADVMVMGAYGHSRMREYVFGGATRTVLQSMTVPVLMSH